MKPLQIALLFCFAWLTPSQSFGHLLEQKDRFNHPANHFFVKSGWRDELLKRERSVDGLQKYVIEHSKYIFEGKIIKQTYEYSKKAINTTYGRERYAINTVLISYQFKGNVRVKSIILKTRHGYEADTVYALTGHNFIPKTLNGYEGEAVFFCNKVGEVYQLEWEDAGYICVEDSGLKAFVGIGQDIIEKYGKHRVVFWGLKEGELLINNAPLPPDRERLYQLLASFSIKKNVRKRFLDRAKSFNGNEKRVSTIQKIPTSISFTITHPN